jgi:predicted GIY-YIG superfamily endonuclease
MNLFSILENIEHKKNILNLRFIKGVYLLYKEDELMYVGVSHDIVTRIHAHKLSKGLFWDRVEFIEEKDWRNAIIIEDYFIDKYRPKYNKQFNNLKRFALNPNWNIKEAKGPIQWRED